MNNPAPRRAPFLARILGTASLALLVAACGGGGGGGGGSSSPSGPGGNDNPGPGSQNGVLLAGIEFMVNTGTPTSTPPANDPLNGNVPAPLNTTILFHFEAEDGGSALPVGTFDSSTLRIFATPGDVGPDVVLASQSNVTAKGTYVVDGATIEFHPFVPTAPLTTNLIAGPQDGVPGLLPGTRYTVEVPLNLAGDETITNLVGAKAGVPNVVTFETTSNEAAYFISDASDGLGPQIVTVSPAEGTVDFFPHVYSNVSLEDQALATGLTSFPTTGPSTIVVAYDRQLDPSSENLEGSDRDGDGFPEPPFFLRGRATELLVSHEILASSGLGTFAGALSGLAETGSPDPAGGDVFVHSGPGTIDGTPASPTLIAAPDALAIHADANLLYLLFKQEPGDDLLQVVDHVQGDPSFAAIGTSAAVSTGLDDLVGLTMLQDGRLVGYDRTTRRIYELVPTVTRDRPLGVPELVDVEVNLDGTTAGVFRSATMTSGVELLALAQAPSGDLYALADDAPATSASPTTPVIVRLQLPDSNVDGVFSTGDGLFIQSVRSLFDAYRDMVFVDEQTVLALNGTADTVDHVDLVLGPVGVAVSDVGGYGNLGPGEPSPARAIALGFMEYDVDPTIVFNTVDSVSVELEPHGVLPFGEGLTLYERPTVKTIGGIDRNLAEGDYVLGAREVVSFSTAEPIAGPMAEVDDVFLEEFTNKEFEDPDATSLSPNAQWAALTSAGVTTGGLRASIGAPEGVEIGDFLPQPNLAYDPDLQFSFNPTTQLLVPTRKVFLDTDAQNFPLLDGSTPGISSSFTVFGGRFVFRDFILPAGVELVVRGSNPIVITVTGDCRIDGIIDLEGRDGDDDITFNTGFIPVPGGLGGPGAGRGGEGHPTVFNPANASTLNQYATPETGGHGFAPIIDAQGTVTFQRRGGRGGVSAAGFVPFTGGSLAGYPQVPNGQPTNAAREKHRPPGGGGGSFWQVGQRGPIGTGAYRVQSFNNGNYFPFPLCPSNNKITDAVYGNEENQCRGLKPDEPLQCVYLTGNEFPMGGNPGDHPFGDGNPDNDYIGAGGEVPFIIGGQGGGGGGSRVDSMQHSTWSIDQFGSPLPTPPAPPCYPALVFGPLVSPTALDAKGGGGGGGGGSILIRSFGDIVISRSGHIHAIGGDGGGGEQVGNSNYAGGGAGGSGGAIVLQAAGEIRVEADAYHHIPHFANFNDATGNTPGAQGACLDVSGGKGKDALTEADATVQKEGENDELSYSDGGHGGFGLIQLQQGSGDGMPEVQQGAFLWAGVRSYLKLGPWLTSNNLAVNFSGKQKPHPNIPNEIVDLLDERFFELEQSNTPSDPFPGVFAFYPVNGSFPPIIQPDPVQDPELVGDDNFVLDSPMFEYFGKMVVREPQPERVLFEYVDESNPPGTFYDANADIPYCQRLTEPGGELILENVDGVMRVPDRFIVDRLPVVPIGAAPPPLASVSRGTSKWLDFNGVVLRMRDTAGLAGTPPPFFEGVFGTYNAFTGPVPAGLAGHVRAVADAGAGAEAKLVDNAGPGDPGLFGATPVFVPKNDIAVDAPELGLEDAISNNASVQLLFQGAYPIRAGSHVADPETLTEWVPDLRELSGYPLVRFQVTFDVAASSDPQFDFGPDSMRPLADYVRVRAEY